MMVEIITFGWLTTYNTANVDFWCFVTALQSFQQMMTVTRQPFEGTVNVAERTRRLLF